MDHFTPGKAMHTSSVLILWLLGVTATKVTVKSSSISGSSSGKMKISSCVVLLPEGNVTVPVLVPVSLKSVLMGVMAQVMRAAPKDPLRVRVSWTVVGKSDGSSTST